MTLPAPLPKARIRVLIVDDSATVRSTLTRVLEKAPDIHVVGTAADGRIARDRIVQLKPDVVTLDMEMPDVDGMTLLRAVMKHAPVPIVVISSVTPRGSSRAFAAIEAGAVDVLCKPTGAMSLGDLEREVVQRVRAAALSVRREPTAAAPPPSGMQFASRQIVGLVASTGGTEALRHVLDGLPANCPPVVIVQHIPPVFSARLAERLNKSSQLDIREAEDGEILEAGMARIARGDMHLLVDSTPSGYRTKLRAGPRVQEQRPSGDVLLMSLASSAGSRTVAAILTGMGEDGVDGLMQLREAGATTFAQDQASSVVYGMPREAFERGAAMREVSLSNMARAILGALKGR